MTTESARFDFPAGLDHVSDVRSEAERMATRMGFPIQDVEMIGTSVWEATLNAVTHGSPFGEQQRVQVEIEARGDALTITVSSENPEFVLSEVRPALTPITRRGRGLIIIRSFMDEVRLVRDGKCTLVMTKRLPSY